MALRTPLPLPAEGGVEVNLGNSDDGMGLVQPPDLVASSQASPPPPAESGEEDLLTEETEEAPAIEPKKNPKPTPVEKTEPKPTIKSEPVPPTPTVDPRALFPGKGTGNSKTGQGGNEGITGKPGDQGKPTGDPNATGYTGTGGSGGGVSFDLGGRSSKQLPRPSTNFSEEGTVVVTIFVSRSGTVTRAIAGAKGTTTASTRLRQLAEQAAKLAKFSAKDDAPEEQKGTITYIFELN